MRRLGAVLLAVSLAGTTALACSAPPNEEGGTPRFDASPPSTSEDAGLCVDDSDAGTGDTWTSLYADYFGPTGKASCAGTGVCHGDTTQAGYLGSNYDCGHTAADCYTGITSAAAGIVTAGQPVSDPTTTGLYVVLRKCSGGVGSMPKAPADVAFTTGDMARIGAWIQAGAPND
jgi:hypothetical protein